MTSLNNGFASRDTCSHGPVSTYLPVVLSKMRDLRRLAVAQTPITESACRGLVGWSPCRVTSEIGTCNAIECTL